MSTSPPAPSTRNDRFPAAFEEALARDLNCTPGMIERVHYDFVQQRTLIPDAPEVHELTVDAVQGVFAIHNYDYTNDEGWAAFVARVTKIESTREQSNNPFLPNWNTKTDDKPTPWLNDCGPMIAQQYKESLTRIFNAASPVALNLFDLIGTPPTSDPGSLSDVIMSLEVVSDLMVDGIGESTDENNAMFRWSRALCSLAGLGLDALRHFAKRITPMEGDWTHWANCSDAELREDIIEARKISCYPISLLRADYKDLQDVCADGGLSPRWLKASLAVHLCKHVRRSASGNELVVAYRGAYGRFLFKAEGLNAPLGDDVNAPLRRSICKILGVRQATGKERQSIDDSIISAVFKRFHPAHFLIQRDLSTEPELIVPKAVFITPSHELRSDYKWINTGLMIRGFAEIDTESGKVDKDATLSGPRTISLAWPVGSMSESERITWRGFLPSKVSPLRPSQTLKAVVRNVNDLGHAEGYWALLDAVIITDLIRNDLAGSPVGGVLGNEFPAMFIYPMGATKEETTNQGKTNFGRIIGNVLAPGLPVTHAGKTPSAPSQRATASPIEEFGTALYDEFTLPQSHEHFLCQAGLQTLMTGGRGGPGRVGENSKGFYLRHPLLFTCKVSAFPPDIRNRSVPTFLDVLTAENRCSDKELADVMSGKLSIALRLAALMWVRSTGFVETVKKTGLIAGTFRFNGHGTVAALLTKSKTTAEVDAYLVAAGVQCDAQQVAADESGLSSDIGIHAGFDPAYFFADMKEKNARMLSEKCNAEPVKGSEVLRHIVEDTVIDHDRRRHLPDILRKHHLAEQTAVRVLIKAIEDGRMKHPDGLVMKRINRTYREIVNGREVGKSRLAIIVEASEEKPAWWEFAG